MITIATLLWDANKTSYPFSRMYDESWVTRLLHGFSRNLSLPFRFVLFTDRERHFPGEDIIQERLSSTTPSYGDCIEPFRLNMPTIIVGLDTVITGPVNHFAEYCLKSKMIALPRDPNQPHTCCNGVALVPAGHSRVFEDWRGENDMLWLRKQPHVFIDDMCPDQVVSYKARVKKNGLGDARIVYFHGDEKPHQLTDQPWIRKHWLGEHG